MRKIFLGLWMLACGLSLQAQKDSSDIARIQMGDQTIELRGESLQEYSEEERAALIARATSYLKKLQQENERQLGLIRQMQRAGRLSADSVDGWESGQAVHNSEVLDRLSALLVIRDSARDKKLESWWQLYRQSSREWESAGREIMRDSTSGGAHRSFPEIPPLPEGALEGERDTAQSNRLSISIGSVRITRDGSNWIIGTEKDEEAPEVPTPPTPPDAPDAPEPPQSPGSEKVDRSDNYFDIGLGFNQQLEEGIYLVEDLPGEQSFWKSTSFQMGLGRKTRLGTPYSPWHVKYGIEFSWHNFRLTGNQILEQDPAGGTTIRGADSGQSLNKSKYHSAYFNVPLMFQWDNSGPGLMDEGWTLGLGGYAGVRLNAKRELEYQTAQLRKVEETSYGDWSMNRFRYGAMAQAGYGKFKVTVTYDINSFFRSGDAPRGLDYNMVNLILGFSI